MIHRHDYSWMHSHELASLHNYSIIHVRKYSKYSLQFSAWFAPLKLTNFIVIHSRSHLGGLVGTRRKCCKCAPHVASVASVLRVRCFPFYSPVVVAVFFISSFLSVCIELCKLNCKCVLLTLTHTDTHSCTHSHTHSHSYTCCLHSWQLQCKQTPPTSPQQQQQLFKHTLTHSHTHSLTHSHPHTHLHTDVHVSVPSYKLQLVLTYVEIISVQQIHFIPSPLERVSFP